MNDLVEMIKKSASLEDPRERRIAVASVITKAMIDYGLEAPVIIGGSAVEIYTFGNYSTEDIDMICDEDSMEYKVMGMLGFSRTGRYCYDASTKCLVEFPKGPLAGSKDRVVQLESEFTGYPIYVISLEDLILDRLESYFATQDNRSFEWARILSISGYEEIDWSYFHKSSNERGILKEVERFQRTVKWDYRKLRELGNNETSSSGTQVKFFK